MWEGHSELQLNLSAITSSLDMEEVGGVGDTSVQSKETEL